MSLKNHILTLPIITDLEVLNKKKPREIRIVPTLILRCNQLAQARCDGSRNSRLAHVPNGSFLSSFIFSDFHLFFLFRYSLSIIYKITCRSTLKLEILFEILLINLRYTHLDFIYVQHFIYLCTAEQSTMISRL